MFNGRMLSIVRYLSINQRTTYKEAAKALKLSERSIRYLSLIHIQMCIRDRYDDEDATELRQCVVLTDEAVNCYNIWDHFFTKEKLLSEIQTAGFNSYVFYGDVAGTEFSNQGETICGVFTKQRGKQFSFILSFSILSMTFGPTWPGVQNGKAAALRGCRSSWIEENFA